MTFWEFLLSIAIVAIPAPFFHWLGVPSPWYIFVGPLVVFVWYFLGCCILASIDEDGRLFAWAKRCPFGFSFVPLMWPAVMWKYWREDHK